MATTVNQEYTWKYSRRSKKRRAGDGSLQRRVYFTLITILHACLISYYLSYYKTSLPLYQKNTLIVFYAFYIFRTNVGNFMLRLQDYYSMKAVIALGLFCFPLLTFPPYVLCRPLEKKAGIQYMVGVSLYVIGSLIHSSYEFTRHFFKQNVQRDQLYTMGLASIVRHPNFFGDLLLYIGWNVLANNLWTMLIPCYQFYHFHKNLIPELEGYLQSKYGNKQWKKYRNDVKASLIPFVL